MYKMPHVTIVAHLNSQFARDIAARIREGLNSQNVIVNLVETQNLEMAALVETDAIVFGCPTIMGSPSARFKTFMESTQPQLYNQTFRNKMAAGFTFGDPMSGDKSATIQALSNFAAQHSMIWVPQGDIAQNEGVNSNLQINPTNSYLGNISEIQMNNNDIYINNNIMNVPLEFSETAYYFGVRIGHTVNRWIQ
jgi:NAD(P)H dehydrogenase (quinone)